MNQQREKPKKSFTFYGHGIPTIVINIFSAVIAPFFIPNFLANLIKLHSLGEVIWQGGIILIPFPFALASPPYLCYEIKHVIWKDGIADDKILGKIAFSCMSILGYITGVLELRGLLAVLPNTHNWILLELIGLSFIAAFGGAIGLTDGLPHEILFPRYLLKSSLQIIRGKLILTVIIMTVALTIGVLAINAIHQI